MRLIGIAPEYFDVVTKDNPWMEPGKDPVDIGRARCQWDTLFDAYARLGAEVHILRAEPKLYDQCFVANAFWQHRGTVVLANFVHRQRQPERYFIERFFGANAAAFGLRLATLPLDIAFEGGGDALAVGERVLLGWGQRSHKRAARHLAAVVGAEVTPLRLVNPLYYHLDTCLLWVPTAGVLYYYADAFDYEGESMIKSLGHPAYSVGREDAENFCLNGVPLGKTIVMNEPTRGLRRDMERRGIEIVSLDTSEFKKSGGDKRCLTNFLDDWV